MVSKFTLFVDINGHLISIQLYSPQTRNGKVLGYVRVCLFLNFCKTMLESNNAMPPQHHHHHDRGLAASKDTKKDEAKSLW